MITIPRQRSIGGTGGVLANLALDRRLSMAHWRADMAPALRPSAERRAGWDGAEQAGKSEEERQATVLRRDKRACHVVSQVSAETCLSPCRPVGRVQVLAEFPIISKGRPARPGMANPMMSMAAP